MKPEDFYKLTIGQTIWYNDKEVEIGSLVTTEGLQARKIHFVHDYHDYNWIEMYDLCSFTAPERKVEVTAQQIREIWHVCGRVEDLLKELGLEDKENSKRRWSSMPFKED